MSTEEMCRFQGFHADEVPWEEAGLARTLVNGALGNAMSINVLERLLPRALESAGVLEEGDWKDFWAGDPDYNPTKRGGMNFSSNHQAEMMREERWTGV